MKTYVDPAREHLPDLTTVDGVIDFFALCMLGIFCNILDIRTYQCGPDMTPSKFLQQFHVDDDTNNISVEERYKCIRTRGLAYDLIFWFFNTHEVANNDTHEPMTRDTWFIPHLVRVTATMVRYVETYQRYHVSNIIKNEFRGQVELCFQSEHEIQAVLKKVLKSSSKDQSTLNNTLAYVGPRNLTITVRSKSLYISMLTDIFILLPRDTMALYLWYWFSGPGQYYLLYTGFTGGDFLFFGIPEDPEKDTPQDADSERDGDSESDDGCETADSENEEDRLEDESSDGLEAAADDENKQGEGESPDVNSAENLNSVGEYRKKLRWRPIDHQAGATDDTRREQGEPEAKKRRLL